MGQVALSLVLLVGSGLLIRSLVRLQQQDPGFDPSGMLTMEVQLPAHYESSEARESFYAGALERIAALPGVRDASGADRLPPSGGPWNYLWPRDRPPKSRGETPRATRRMAMDGYFRTLGVPVLAGRTFLPTDREGAPTVVVVSRTLAEQFFPGEKARGAPGPERRPAPRIGDAAKATRGCGCLGAGEGA